MSVLKAVDEPIWKAIQAEERRQFQGLEMIASENYTSAAVLECQGSVLTNKYAEGYPGKRYYGGCEHVDVVEQLAIERAKQLFGAEFANVQPHSGASANMAVFLACLQPGDAILAMDLAHGGHLTHGAKVNFSGKHYRIVSYGVSQATEQIDYDQVAKLARQEKPKMILAGASAYPRTIDFARFAEIAAEVGAIFLVDMAHIAGLVASGMHPSPVPFADFVSSTAHKTLRGPRSGFVVCREKWGKALNSAVFPGLQGGPLMHAIAGKAVTFVEAMTPAFKTYGRQIVANAKTLADALLAGGLRLVSGGTDNHLILIDVTVKSGLSGLVAEKALGQAGITVNKNMLPYDPRKPADPSGIRIGTPALTTRGMKEAEMNRVAGWILQVLSHADQPGVLDQVHAEIKEFCVNYPVPGIALGKPKSDISITFGS